MKTRLRFVLHLAAILLGISLCGQAYAKSNCPDVIDDGKSMWSEISSELKKMGKYNRSDVLAFRDDVLKPVDGQESDPADDARFREVFDCHLATDPLLAEGGASAAARSAGTPVVGTSATGSGPRENGNVGAVIDLNGEWEGQRTGNRVRIQVRSNGILVIPITSNPGQTAEGMLYRGSGTTYRMGEDSVIEVQGPNKFQGRNSDGWNEIFERK